MQPAGAGAHGGTADIQREQQERIEALALLAAAGDAAALDALLGHIRPLVLRRCSKVLPFPEDAEEACQDVLVAVARGIRRFEGRSRFTTWLYPIVARTAFATYRRARAAAPPRSGPPAAEPVDPNRVSVLAGARVEVVEALERLRAEQPVQAEAVILRDLMGMPYEEIAQQLDLPLGTAKSRISTGRSALRALLTHAGQR